MSHVALRSKRSRRWPLFGALFALLLIASSARAEDEEKECSDTTRDNRPCSASEEVMFCQTNAIEALIDCRDAQPWYLEPGCWLLYEVDWHVCLLIFPLEPVVNALK